MRSLRKISRKEALRKLEHYNKYCNRYNELRFFARAKENFKRVQKRKNSLFLALLNAGEPCIYIAKDEDYAELEALVNWPLKQLINKWGVYHMYYDLLAIQLPNGNLVKMPAPMVREYYKGEPLSQHCNITDFWVRGYFEYFCDYPTPYYLENGIVKIHKDPKTKLYKFY